jgi:vacuolar-type H+-ATPase subunit E/Vma4
MNGLGEYIPYLLIAGFLIVGVVVIRILVIIGKLSTSFNKLGYVLREDAKKYFDDASIKIVDTNRTFHSDYQTIVTEGTRQALAESGTVLKDTYSEAHKEAGDILISARQNAEQIVAAARKQAVKEYQQAINNSVDAMEWALLQYANDSFSISNHKEIIEELLRKYLNENRS